MEVTKSVVPHLNARISANLFNFDLTNQYREIEYNGKGKLLNIGFIGDMYPWKKSGFHLSVGAMLSNNRLDGDAKLTGDKIEIGGDKYDVNDFASVKANVNYPGHIAPYIGLGWGNPVAFNKNLSININAGVVFPGAPQVNFDATIKDTVPPDIAKKIQDSIEVERQKLQKQLDGYSIYPVVSLSFSYQF
ncbi:MAG: hypothetical protein WCD18_09425 [Thermosynechococcaceae cyanobacterium]